MKPNVLFIIDSFEQGGSERQAMQLLTQLHASGKCRVRLACLQNRGSLRTEAEQLGIGEIHEYALNSFYDLNFTRQLRRLVHFIKENEIDVVHTHCFYTNIFGMTGAFLAGVRARGDAALLRIDEVHHTIALFPTDRAGIQHINHQVATGDDVMRSFNFLSERQVPMVFGPGRHPTSSARFLYFEGPDGMVFEYSSGVREIADELLYRERQLPFEPKGFCEWGAKPQIKEFRN